MLTEYNQSLKNQRLSLQEHRNINQLKETTLENPLNNDDSVFVLNND